MDVAYDLGEEDLREANAQLVALRRAAPPGVLRFALAIALAGGAGWLAWRVAYPGQAPLVALRGFLATLAAAAAIAALLVPLLARRRAPRLDAWVTRRLARASARRSVLGPVTVRLDGDEVIRRNASGEVRLPRGAIRDVLVTRRLLTIRPRGPGPLVLLPARAFAGPEPFARARARVEALLGAPARDLEPDAQRAAAAGARAPGRRLPPELTVALALALAAGAADVAAARAHDPRRTNPAGHVVIYATDGCPACALLRECLARSGVPFEERNVERSPGAGAEWASLGGRGVPVTLVGAEPVYGLDPGALAAALGAAGHRFACPGATPDLP